MNRRLYAVALLAALGTAGLAHAQTTPAPPAAKPSSPAAAPSPAEPIKQIPDPGLPNTSTGCDMGTPQSSGSPAQPASPSSNRSAQPSFPSSSIIPPLNPAAPCR